ncbi:hypothetical protein L7F22_027168 [Adiantum nelumboides]|nr:hypothetical protein [Adiantum nelumboides]
MFCFLRSSLAMGLSHEMVIPHSRLFRSPTAITHSFVVIPVQRLSCRAAVRMGSREDGLLHQSDSEKSWDSEKSLDSDGTWSSLSAIFDGEHGAYSDSSESLLGFSSSLFYDVSSCAMDKEDPPEYIPAPTQNAADFEQSKRLEDVLYTLREVLPGSVRKAGMNEKLLVAWRLVHHDIKVQDSLVCLQGKDTLQSWLRCLAFANAQVNLHDIYAERMTARPCQNCIYAIWTVSFPGNLQLTSKPSILEGVKDLHSEFSISGESKFEIDGTGQVISVVSKWYVPYGGKEMLEQVKNYLILCKSICTAN